MKQIFSGEGVRALRMSWILLLLALVAGAAIVAGGNWYHARAQRERAASGQRLQEARARLDAARRERDSLKESAEVFRGLVDRGLLQGERRLELVETVNALRTRHQLAALDYEIAPQRPLQLAGGRAFPAVDVLASRVRVRLRALHEGDVVGFLDDLGASRQGFYPVERCALRRLDGSPNEPLHPRVEAECMFEWITLKEKHAGRPG